MHSNRQEQNGTEGIVKEMVWDVMDISQIFPYVHSSSHTKQAFSLQPGGGVENN